MSDEMAIGDLARVGRTAAYTRHLLAGERTEASLVLLDELEATGCEVTPFIEALALLVGTVADRRPEDLDAFLGDIVGSVMADLVMHRTDPRSA